MGQSEDRRQVEATQLGFRLQQDRKSQDPTVLLKSRKRPSSMLPKAYPVAARQLPLRSAADHLTRSSLHRCLKRHGISRAAPGRGEASPKRKFKAYPIGYFHIDIAEVRTAQGKLYLLVAIDRTSKFAFVELHEKVTRKTAADFLRRLIAAVPYRSTPSSPTTGPLHLWRTWSPAEIKEMIASRRLFHAHAFEYACTLNEVDHRLTKPKHP